MTLEEAWAEFQETAEGSGFHVGSLEAKQLLEEITGKREPTSRRAPLTPEQQEQGRFLDWLLYVKKDKALAYEFLQRAGTLTVGPRQYWISDQGQRRAIAWESRHSYPGTDSEVWDLIFVD